MNHHPHNHEGHTHPEENNIPSKNLLASALLNLLVTVAEVIGGLVSNSLALFSDALHNLGDTSAIFIAFLANRIGMKKGNTRKTFGFKRIEILAALFNAIVLVVIIIYLFIEAWHRLANPMPIKGLIMLLVAIAGLLANLFSVLLLKSHASHSINIKAAYLHLIGDTVSSVMVIITAILIYFFNIYWIDPLVTFLLGIYLLWETFRILKVALDILMQSTPEGLDLGNLKKSLETIPGVDNIHHVHAWNLTDQNIHFECHVDLTTDVRISETEGIRIQMEEMLYHDFSISHVTIQFEYNCCDDKNMIHNR
jgi:cobalt-zinc-cadmium efflux system protein